MIFQRNYQFIGKELKFNYGFRSEECRLGAWGFVGARPNPITLLVMARSCSVVMVNFIFVLC